MVHITVLSCIPCDWSCCKEYREFYLGHREFISTTSHMTSVSEQCAVYNTCMWTKQTDSYSKCVPIHLGHFPVCLLTNMLQSRVFLLICQRWYNFKSVVQDFTLMLGCMDSLHINLTLLLLVMHVGDTIDFCLMIWLGCPEQCNKTHPITSSHSIQTVKGPNPTSVVVLMCSIINIPVMDI